MKIISNSIFIIRPFKLVSYLKKIILFGAIGLFFLSPGYAQSVKPVNVVIDFNKTVQQIDNFGASGAWFSESIGRYWNPEIKERMAECLFSKAFDPAGNPKGIGLSSWRFNIGGGTAEQGDSSGMKQEFRRVECFLKPDGSYDWSKQAGYLWFIRKAKYYGLESLIAFSNTPPVNYTKNGLGYKTIKDFTSNLKTEKYPAYANFLTEVITHFDKEGLHFNYISPVNEPQWDWSQSYGSGSQEGSPWANEEIAKIVRALDSCLLEKKSQAKILITEAGNLGFLYGREGKANHQIQTFFGTESPLRLNQLTHVPAIIGGHSYFTDKGDSNRIAVRKTLADTAKKYGVTFWQTEYSMLGDGYQEGKKQPIPAIDCALFLSKVIHDDLVYSNAKAWQLWNSWEPGNGETDNRYFLIALHPEKDWKSGTISITKNLWALGQYSRFIRPGMTRLNIDIRDGLTEVQRAQNVMVSAFTDSLKQKLVVVVLNYSHQQKSLQFSFKDKRMKGIPKIYCTTADAKVNMELQKNQKSKNILELPERSITTCVWSN